MSSAQAEEGLASEDADPQQQERREEEERRRREALRWCTKGAFAKRGGNVGEVQTNPNADGEVRVCWSNGAKSYLQAADLSQASTADQRSAAGWCKRGVEAKFEGRLGTLTIAPDSDAEVKLKWDDGSESGYLKAAKVQRTT